MKNVFAILTVALLLAAPLSAGSDAKVHADVVYGHKMGMALTFDALVPAEQNGAAVLFMVSGGWFSRWSDPHRIVDGEGGRAGAVGDLLDHGYAVFMVRHGSAPLFKVPDAVADVRRAVRYIRLNADDFGVDPDRMGVFGGSAGGHLSLMLGNASDEGNAGSKDPIEQTGNRVAAVVAYFPPVDLQGITGPNDRFPALDFDPAKAADISPVLFVSEDDPPTLLIHGDQDQLVPLSNSERIKAAFDEANVTSKLIVIEGAAHGFRGEDGQRASSALVAWFNEHLGVSSD
ncbi:MAG: alpha/beta hydrolase [Holophagales bacterium]|nr:alpha/beta hydrolase [Holophagales bacterium]MYF03725.1 alpha/beta hydrolase [Holophagales bacterium]MYJ25844.1 alpha/beta hydrolase [Holophagales bacterium]